MDELAKPDTLGGRLTLDCSAWGRAKRRGFGKQKPKQYKSCNECDSGKLSACHSCCPTITVRHSNDCPQLLVFYLFLFCFLICYVTHRNVPNTSTTRSIGHDGRATAPLGFEPGPFHPNATPTIAHYVSLQHPGPDNPKVTLTPFGQITAALSLHQGHIHEHWQPCVERHRNAKCCTC